MKNPEQRADFNKQYSYSFKNIAREALFIIPVFIIVTGVVNRVSWKVLLLTILGGVVLAILQIALQRYLFKKGKLNYTPVSKYYNKSYKEIQEEKVKSKDV